MTKMRMVAENMPGYKYGSADVAKSPISAIELKQLKQSAEFTQEDTR
jgi:hypothetical protein